jgi:glycosyltransferase involved in cell wall biosynthesis
MAAGKAIAAPRQENLMEVLTEGVDALGFEPEDLDGMNAALRRLVEDAGLRERLGAEARRTIARRGLTWEGNAARIIDAFREVAAGRPAVAAATGAAS